jgi:NADH:ubiquinone oxidoreductase subunit 2 (subunit N)
MNSLNEPMLNELVLFWKYESNGEIMGMCRCLLRHWCSLWVFMKIWDNHDFGMNWCLLVLNVVLLCLSWWYVLKVVNFMYSKTPNDEFREFPFQTREQSHFMGLLAKLATNTRLAKFLMLFLMSARWGSLSLA